MQTLLERNYIDQKIHWTQCTRQAWLQLLDRNNKFFQTMATIRKKRNSIWKIKDSHGNWFDDQDEISQVITMEFQK